MLSYETLVNAAGSCDATLPFKPESDVDVVELPLFNNPAAIIAFVALVVVCPTMFGTRTIPFDAAQNPGCINIYTPKQSNRRLKPRNLKIL